MEFIGLAILLYIAGAYIWDVYTLVHEWVVKYRDDKQAIAKAMRIGHEYSNMSEEDAHSEWLGFARRHGIDTEE